MSNTLKINHLQFTEKYFRWAVFLVIFCVTTLCYGQAIWTRKVNGVTTATYNTDNLSIARGISGSTPIEYTRKPVNKASWYSFFISAKTGYGVFRVDASGNESLIVSKVAWSRHLGRCYLTYIYLKEGESLRIKHNGNNTSDNLNITNFEEIVISKITKENCINNKIALNIVGQKGNYSDVGHINLNPENKNCETENGHAYVSRHWSIKKITKNTICGSEIKRVSNDIANSGANAFDLIKQVCPTDPYGTYEIMLEYVFKNGSGQNSMYSAPITVTVPELKKPPIISECVKNIKTASWKNNGLETSADRVEINKSALNILIEDELSCCQLSWFITEKNSTIVLKNSAGQFLKGTGQPSAFAGNIDFEGSGITEKKYTITYTLGCSGQTKTEEITIKPRPNITLSN